MQNLNSNERAEKVDVTTLLTELTDSDPNRRSRAVKALRELRDPQIVETLVAALEKRPEQLGGFYHDFRREVVLALGRIGNARAIEVLISLLGEKSLEGFAAVGLGEARDERGVEPLIAALEKPVVDVVRDWDRHHIARALGRIGGARVLEYLMALLQHGYPQSRIYAAEGLQETRDPRIVEPLIAALKDQDDGVRTAAANALGDIGDERAILPLIDALNDEWWVYAGEDHFYPVRTAARNALKTIGSPVIDVLIAMLQSPDTIRRRQAAWSLGEMGDLRAVEPLMAAMNDSDESVRRGAQASLEDLRNLR